MQDILLLCLLVPVIHSSQNNRLDGGGPVELHGKLDVILEALANLREDIDQLKGKITLLQPKKGKSDHVCKERDPSQYYVIQNCGNHTQGYKQYFVIDGDNNNHNSKAEICRLIVPTLVHGKSYKITAKMYNNVGPMGVNSGYLGFAYNVEDEFNFDFVYISIHQAEKCYQSGFLQKGRVIWSNKQTGPCPEGPPSGREWFRLTLYVTEMEATLYINGVQVSNLVPHYSTIGRGGLVIATGKHNMMQFKHYNISSTSTAVFKFMSCRSHSKVGDSYNIMVAEEGKWPTAGFCRAISKITVNRQNYEVSVSLYNQGDSSSRDGGLLGVIYNVHNYYNYDFIYFRPSSRGGCYTTGFVQNSQIQWMNSKVGPCPGGPKGSGMWFNVSIEIRGSLASIQLSGKHIISTNTHFSPLGRGGVLMANGNKNIAAFRNYHLKAIPPYPFAFHNCAGSTKEIEDYFILDAKHGKWPQNTFCMAVAKTKVSGPYYFMAVEIFMQGTLPGRETDYAGIIFNVENENNYEFVYLTPHGYKFCFKAGFVLNGEIQWASVIEGKCVGFQPKSGVWIQLEVTVSNEDAMISLEGRHLITYRPHYPATGKGGVIVGNGFRNVLTFRNFVLYETRPFMFSFHSCGEGTHITNSSTVLDASLPRHRPLLFCRALYRNTSNTSMLNETYAIQATLFNIDSWRGGDWGNLGIIYNAKDYANFDFVFLNFESQDECYQYGSLFNGVPRYNREFTGRCEIKPPASKWFKLRLYINHMSNTVKMRLNDKDIGTIKSNSPYNPRGGVLVPNGFKNIIMFRDFKISKS